MFLAPKVEDRIDSRDGVKSLERQIDTGEVTADKGCVGHVRLGSANLLGRDVLMLASHGWA